MKELRKEDVVFAKIRFISHTCLALIAIALTSGCGKISMSFGELFQAPGADAIAGKVIGAGIGKMSASSNTTFSCSNAQISLYKTNDNGEQQGASLATTSVGADGSFSVKNVSSLGADLSSQSVHPYLLELSGCTSTYRRFVTGSTSQDISPGSSLASYVAALAPLTSMDAGKLDALLSSVSSATSELAAYSLISSNTNLQTQFQTALGANASSLLTAAPLISSVSVPSASVEGGSMALSVQATHWSPTYQIVNEWHDTWNENGTARDQFLSSASNFSWSVTANKQGAHRIRLLLGQDDGSGRVDLTKPYRETFFATTISDTTPVSVPSGLVFGGTLVSGIGYTSSASISLTLPTGTLGADGVYQNCQNFSDLAIIESDDTAPLITPPTSAQWTVRCQTATTQSIPLVLTTGEGNKTLRVWARDSAGNVTASPLSVHLKYSTVAPVVAFTSPANSSSVMTAVTVSGTCETTSGNVTLSGPLDDGAGHSSVSVACTSDTWSTPISLTGSDGSKTLTASQTNLLSLTGTATRSLVKDSTPPVLTLTSPVAGFNTQSDLTLVGACETGDTVSLTGDLTSVSSFVCTGGVFSVGVTLTSGDGSKALTLSESDVAGNISTVSRSFVRDTVAPSAPTLTRTSAAYSNSLIVTTNVVCSADTTQVLYSTSLVPPALSDAAWESCGSTKSLTAASGDGVTTFYAYARDAAGNISTASSVSATIDQTAPVMTSFSINNGDTVTLSANVVVRVNASDALSGVTSVRFANAAGADCQGAYADTNWQSFTNGGGVQAFSFTTGFANGTKQVCAWAKDQAGNVSQITTNSGQGSVGVDMATIKLDQGSPPAFSTISVTNGNSSSANYGTTTFAVGDAVNVTFTVTDDSALATNPVSMYVTTDNTNYTLIASSTTLGSPGVAQVTWTKSYNTYTAPTSGYFKLRFVALDANGNTAQMDSTPLNTASWSLFAGNADIGDGSSALSARIRTSSVDYIKNYVAVNSSNVVFISTSDGIRKVDPTTGNITTYLSFGAQTGVPGIVSSSTRIAGSTADMVMDGNDLYIRTSNYIYLVNTSTNAIKRYLGGGTDIDATTASNLALGLYHTLTIDPTTKDLYIVNDCDISGTTTGASYTYSLRIQKVTQDTSTQTAQTVSDIAGNCVKSTSFVSGPATSTPLENSLYYKASGSLVYVPSVGALYFNAFGTKPVKIIGGNIYQAPSYIGSGSFRGAVYISSQNKVYVSSAGDGVSSFTPNNHAAFDEVSSLYIHTESSCSLPTCRNDGVALSSAGVYTSSVFAMNGQLGIVDNTVNRSTISRVRLVDATTNTLQTLAGTDRFVGGDRMLARFAGISDIVYKSVATASQPAGLYMADSGASRILTGTTTASDVTVTAGNGISKTPSNGDAFGTSSAVGAIGSGGTLSNLAIDPSNMLTFGYHNVFTVTVASVISAIFTGSGADALTATEGASGTSFNVGDGEQYAGYVYDGNGNLYFGGYILSLNYNKLKVRTAAGVVWTVIGTGNSVAADCATPGCAQSLTLSGSSTRGSGGNHLVRPYDDRYNSGEGRLLFAEGNTIRFVSKAYDPTSSQYGTLTDQSGSVINMGRPVGAAIFTYVDSSSEQIDRIYYISSNYLYCYKVSTGADPKCTNASLGPSSGMQGLNSGTITIGDDGGVYVVSADSTVVYRYQP